MLAEFTKDDINDLVRQGPSLRVSGGARSGTGQPAAAAPAAPAPAAAPANAGSADALPPGPPPADNPGWGSPTG
jgi:hypothetical protein